MLNPLYNQLHWLRSVVGLFRVHVGPLGGGRPWVGVQSDEAFALMDPAMCEENAAEGSRDDSCCRSMRH